MRTSTVGPFTNGIDRKHVKGGASPTAVYDLLNGYVDITGRAVSRPGTQQDAQLPPGTKGLTVFGGKFHVFATVVTAMADPRYVCDVLLHPTDQTQTLAHIHYADGMAGALYVVAEFANGDVFHYWLNDADVTTWKHNHVYDIGDLVAPTVPNGLVYRAARFDAPSPKWSPKVQRALNDYVEPTTYNGFKYLCIEVDGANPRSGDTEPKWPIRRGATVFEDTNITTTTSPGDTTPDPPDSTGGQTQDRYGTGTGAGSTGNGSQRQ